MRTFLSFSYILFHFSELKKIVIFLFFSEELFNQRIICNIENLGTLVLEEPLNVKDLVLLALEELEASETQPSSQGNLVTQAELIEKTIVSKSMILEKFFNIQISSDGTLTTLPIIVENHTPCLAYLPNYLLNLALCVNWDNERQCFDTFSKVTAKFYAKVSQTIDQKEWEKLVEHILYPTIKQFLYPSKDLIDGGAIVKVTSMPDLYKVFERC